MPQTALINSLDDVRRRVRTLSIAFGVGVVLTAAVALLLAVVSLDWLLNLPALPRLAVILAALGAIGFLLWRWVVAPLLARLTIGDVAGRVEAAFPQFDDRLRSSVNFIEHGTPGSEFMKEKVLGETTSLAAGLNLGQVVVTTPVWQSVGAAVAALALLTALSVFVAGEQFRSIALSRLLTPFSAKQWPRSVQIDLLGAVPSRLPVGQRLDLKMKLTRGDRESRKAIVYYQYGIDGPLQQEYMSRSPDGTYLASIDARVGESGTGGLMRVRIKCGDDEVTLPDIMVVPRLQIVSVIAKLTVPAYVSSTAADGSATAQVDLTRGPAICPAGSTVQLVVGFNKPLGNNGGAAQLEAVDAQSTIPDFIASDSSDNSVSRTWLAIDSLRFRIHATDTDGFSNPALEEFEIVVKPDQPPVVQIENPRRNEDRTPVSVIPLTGLAEDDYGIRALTLVVDRLGDQKHWEIPLVVDGAASGDATWTRVESAVDRLHYRSSLQWRLQSLAEADLKSGNVLEYYLVVQDNFDLNGRKHAAVPSGKLRINIISQEELTSRAVEELRQAKTRIAEIRASQERTRAETQQLHDETSAKPEFDPADRAVADRLSNQQATAASQTKQLAGRLQQLLDRLDENQSPALEIRDITRDVRADLDRAAENPMKQAAAQLGGASQPATPQDSRNKQLESAGESQRKASEDLQRAMDRMEHIGTLQQTIDRFSEILRQQQEVSRKTAEIGKRNLGKSPEEISREDREELNKTADEQAKLADQTAREIAALDRTAQQMKQSDPTASEAMRQAAQTAQQQQVPQNQQKASQQARQNQQSGAQSSQKQVELGLQMILSQLKEAERRKLEELAKQLAELQEQVANLVRRQAGHNIDNLCLQGAEKFAALTEADRTALLQKAGRDASAPSKTDLPGLSGAQELTERNTRDLAKVAEKVPQGADAGAALLKAAGRMERAIVHLRNRALGDAYPPQVEALAALEDAKKRVDQLKEQADQKIAQSQREAIRAQYVKIKEDQEKLNGDTSRIDKSRDGQGNLKRVDEVRLAQLPTEQGKLSERVQELDEALAAVGSVVYSWANRDIAEAMDAVKRELTKPDTSAPTQDEQKRIVEQLDAMIRNLSEKPNQSKFAQDSGGGSGGGSGSRMPSEAELKLLKSFQEFINGRTKTEEARKERDRERLLALGKRQGELRDVLDELIQKSTQGQVQLGKEPDNRDQLPEESGEDQVENQELDQELLNGPPDAEKEEKQMLRVGDRMARSKQRLALNGDPGKVTQLIQKRILQDLDVMIEQARRTSAQARNQPQSKSPQQQQNQPNNQQAQQQAGQRQQGGQSPAQQSTASGGVASGANSSQDIRQSLQEWGNLSPRQRAALLEGSGETVIDKYRKIVDDYYKSLATKASQGGDR